MAGMDQMEMGSALPGWVTAAAWAWIALSLASAAVVLVLIGVRGDRR